MQQTERAKAEVMRWPILEPIDADGQINPIALNKPVCVAGDRGRVNLPLHSPQISRAHALFVADADGIYLRDLASLNGVRVNESRVRETVLHDGDVVKLGPFSFRCVKNFPSQEGAEHSHTEPAELRLEAGSHLPLTNRTLVIGNREDCDVHISDRAVSPAHAVIFERDGRRFIRDLRSGSGTRVNGQAVGEIELQPGDVIQVGQTKLEYASAGGPPSEEALEDALSSAEDESPADEVSLSADDSMIAPSGASPTTSARESDPLTSPAADSAIIPLMDDLDDPAPSQPAVTRSQQDSAPAPSAKAELTPREPADSGVVPIVPVVSGAAEEVFVPTEPPHATAAELLEGHEQVAPTPPYSDSSGSNVSNVHPGTVDREKAEEVFSELLEELADNVEQVQTVWQDLKTSTEDPAPADHPGAPADASPQGKTNAYTGGRGSHKSTRNGR